MRTALVRSGAPVSWTAGLNSPAALNACAVQGAAIVYASPEYSTLHHHGRGHLFHWARPSQSCTAFNPPITPPPLVQHRSPIVQQVTSAKANIRAALLHPKFENACRVGQAAVLHAILCIEEHALWCLRLFSRFKIELGSADYRIPAAQRQPLVPHMPARKRGATKQWHSLW